MKRKYNLLHSSLLYTSFFMYIAILLFLLIFSRIDSIGFPSSTNIIPFHTIKNYMSRIHSHFSVSAFTNVFGNIFVFVPLGMYMPILRSNKKMFSHLAWILAFTVSAEILQWILGIGVFDIDDIILNFLGGFLGWLTYKIMFALFKQEYQVRLLTTFSSITLCILSILYYYN